MNIVIFVDLLYFYMDMYNTFIIVLLLILYYYK